MFAILFEIPLWASDCWPVAMSTPADYRLRRISSSLVHDKPFVFVQCLVYKTENALVRSLLMVIQHSENNHSHPRIFRRWTERCLGRWSRFPPARIFCFHNWFSLISALRYLLLMSSFLSVSIIQFSLPSMPSNIVNDVNWAERQFLKAVVKSNWYPPPILSKIELKLLKS